MIESGKFKDEKQAEEAARLSVDIAEVEEKSYEKLLKGNMSENLAVANSKLFGQFFKKYGVRNKEKFYDWFNKLDIRYNVTPEQLQEQLIQEAQIKNQAFQSEINNSKLKRKDGQFVDIESREKIQKLKDRAKELDLNKKSIFDREDELTEKYKEELLREKEQELEAQGYDDEDIKYELENYEQEAYSDAKDKVLDWGYEVHKYVEEYAETIADYCEKKGYIVDIDKSSQSISTYIKLYEDEEQKEDNAPVKEIRISDHTNGYGDKDVMINYADDIEEALKAIDDEIDNYISDEFIQNYKGFVYDSSIKNDELNFYGLSFPERQRKIKDYYEKYLQTSRNNPNTLHLHKDGIGDLHFSKPLKDALSNKKDLDIALLVLPNIKEIVDKGKVEYEKGIPQSISTDVLYKRERSLFNINLPINIDVNGNWVVDVFKTKINRSALGTNPRISTVDNNIIPHSESDLNPNVNNIKPKFQSAPIFDRNNIENSFNDNVENITNGISEDIKNILSENDISEDEFNFEDIRIYGSYSTGKNNETSDLDVIVQYSGSMREDDAFNMFHDTELTISDKNGNPVTIDINPINVDESGTIDEKLQQMNSVYYQEDIDIPEFLNNIPQNVYQNIDLEKINELISNGITAEKLSDVLPDILKDSVKNIGDYKFVQLKDNNKNGINNRNKKIIKINLKSVGNNPYKFVRTLMHEVEHAYQIIYYNDLIDKREKGEQLSQNDIEYIKTFEECDNLNKEIQKFMNLPSTQKVTKKYREATKGMTQEQKEQYLENMKNTKERDIITKNTEYFNKYFNLYTEISAREAGEYYAKNFKNEIQVIRGAETSFGSILRSLGKWTGRTNFRSLFGRGRGRNGRNSDFYEQGIIEPNSFKTYFQSAYHGTPHKFDKFSTEHIGSGEGAQAHGWGLYFAENKDVSEEYRKRLTYYGDDEVDLYDVKYDGESILDFDFERDLYFVAKEGKNNFIQGLKNLINEYEKDIQDPRFANQKSEFQNIIEDIKNQIYSIEQIDENKIEVTEKSKGQLFEVDIPENDELLDEDNLIIDQDENIKEKLKTVASQIYQDRMDFDTNIINSKEFQLIENIKDGKFSGQGFDYTGKDFYKSLSKILGSPKEASLLHITDIPDADISDEVTEMFDKILH